MNILVVGASGKTGQVLLKQLSQTKHITTGLIRDSAQEKLVTQHGAKYLVGDLTDRLEKIVNGFDAIIFVAGSRGKNVQGVDYQGLVNIVNTAIKTDVKRFLYIGSINVGKNPMQYVQELKDYYQEINEPVPEGLLINTQKPGYHNYVKMKEMAERHLIGSGANYTILRAGLLTLDSGSGKVNITNGSMNAFGKISRENVAKCFIEALENKNTYQRVYTILDGNIPIEKAFDFK